MFFDAYCLFCEVDFSMMFNVHALKYMRVG